MNKAMVLAAVFPLAVWFGAAALLGFLVWHWLGWAVLAAWAAGAVWSLARNKKDTWLAYALLYAAWSWLDFVPKSLTPNVQ